jgi:transmembrane sensor
MTDERLPLSDSSKDRFAEALTDEVSRRFDIYPSLDESSAVADLHARIAASTARQDKAWARGQVPEKKRRLGNQMLLWRAREYSRGAALLLLVALTVFLLKPNTQSRHVPPAQLVYTTGPAEHSVIAIAGGSRAVLGPVTTLTVNVDGSAGIAVTVQGQALFTVPHAIKRPFTVHAGQSVTRVLGTTFMVRRYAGDSVTRVAVVDGRVTVSAAASSANGTSTLGARTLGVISDSGVIRVTPDVAVNDYTAWTVGRLVFKDTPVSEIVTELNRTYNADVRVTDSVLSAQKVTWTIALGKTSLSDAVNALTRILDARAIRSGSVFTIVPGRPTARKPRFPHPTFATESYYGR